MILGERVYVGREFEWTGRRRYYCTSFNDKQGFVTIKPAEDELGDRKSQRIYLKELNRPRTRTDIYTLEDVKRVLQLLWPKMKKAPKTRYRRGIFVYYLRDAYSGWPPVKQAGEELVIVDTKNEREREIIINLNATDDTIDSIDDVRVAEDERLVTIYRYDKHLGSADIMLRDFGASFRPPVIF